MRDKLIKEFGRGSSSNEIEQFNEQFKLMKKLWNVKLSTSFEEVAQMTEALVKLRTSTATLSETLRSKEEAYSKMIENNREAYE